MLLFAKHAKEFVAESFTVTSGSVVERPTPGWTLGAGTGGAVVAGTRGLAVDSRRCA